MSSKNEVDEALATLCSAVITLQVANSQLTDRVRHLENLLTLNGMWKDPKS